MEQNSELGIVHLRLEDHNAKIRFMSGTKENSQRDTKSSSFPLHLLENSNT